MDFSKPLLVMLFPVVPMHAAHAEPGAPPQSEVIQDLLNTSNDWLELVREHWPGIGRGDSLAMAVTYDALNNCSHFRDEIANADTIDDLERLLSNRHPRDVAFAKGIYFKCSKLVNRYDEFPGWRDLRLRAALAGDVRSKVFVALEFYRQRDEHPRESFPYSPAQFLIDAMQSGDSMVFSAIGTLGVDYGLRLDTSATTSLAWKLVSCRIRGDCDEPESMKVFCAFMAPECARWGSVYDYLRHKAGSDEAYAAARQKADVIHSLVRQQRFQELDLDLVW